MFTKMWNKRKKIKVNFWQQELSNRNLWYLQNRVVEILPWMGCVTIGIDGITVLLKFV